MISRHNLPRTSIGASRSRRSIEIADSRIECDGVITEGWPIGLPTWEVMEITIKDQKDKRVSILRLE